MKLHREFLASVGAGFCILFVLNTLGWSIDPSHTQFLPDLCLIKRVFDMECPGCGMTRAMISLVNIDLYSAYSFNQFSFPLLILSLYYFQSTMIRKVKNPYSSGN